MPEHEQYMCEQLSHAPSEVSKWVEKFIALRLPGLENDPKKMYGEESRRSIQEWISVLSKPAYRVVVCAVGDKGDKVGILDREWVGIMLVYGPQIRYRKSSQLQNQSQAPYDNVWFVGGVYVLPAHRKNNITSLLLDHSAQVKVEESSKSSSSTSSPSGVIIQGVVTPQRKGLQSYYKTMNMMPVRRMTRKEHCDQWGIPFDSSVRGNEVIIIERQERVSKSRL